MYTLSVDMAVSSKINGFAGIPVFPALIVYRKRTETSAFQKLFNAKVRNPLRGIYHNAPFATSLIMVVGTYAIPTVAIRNPLRGLLMSVGSFLGTHYG